MDNSVTKKFLSVAAYSFLFLEVSHLVYTLIQHYGAKKTNSVEIRKPGHLWNSAIFFPDGLNSTASRDQLFWYLQQAKRNLKICMYCLTSSAIRKIITERQSEGVNVQIVTMQKSVQNLQLKGYSIRVKPPKTVDDLMHHKFVIIDDEALLTGSLNWTSEGFGGNNENIMITTNPRAVKQYLAEFEKLWNISKP